jgi:putative transposase
MNSIIALLQCVNQSLNKTTFRQLLVIVPAMLAMTGRVTMLGISRWTTKGGSYRTIQRFFNSHIVWKKLNWLLICHHLISATDTFILAGDETIVTKSGKQTYGLDRFFASLFGKPVKGLAFFAVSLVNVSKKQSSVLLMEQLKKSQYPKNKKGTQKRKQPVASPRKRKRGRPKGSKNKNHRDKELPPHLQHLQSMIQEVLRLIGKQLPITYCVFDGMFGNNNALQMVCRCGLHLVSKLRSDAALYLPYTGVQKKRGAKRKYGDKLNYQALPAEYLVSQEIQQKIETSIYHLQVWSTAFPDLLNVVIVVKVNLATHKRAHVVLFSSDLTLSWSNLLMYYRLRFQIEFNFRDAKQFWGLEDFMNIKQTPVYNAANLAMFMVNVSQALIKQSVCETSQVSVNDLKAYFRGRRYVLEILKFLPRPPELFLIEDLFANVGLLGGIHPPSS